MDTAYAIEALKPALSIPETEESWDTISAALTKLSNIVQEGADQPRELVSAIRSCASPINSAMKSERTRLSGTAIECVNSMASAFGHAFSPLIQLFVPTLLLLCARTNKVVIGRARNAIHAIIENTQFPLLLRHLQSSISDKSASLRLASAEATLQCLNCFNPVDIEKEERALEVEVIIKTSAGDQNADIRKVGRKLFEAYKILMPGRVSGWVAPLYTIANAFVSCFYQLCGPIKPNSKEVPGHQGRPRLRCI
jgi:hypothetical protein